MKREIRQVERIDALHALIAVRKRINARQAALAAEARRRPVADAGIAHGPETNRSPEPPPPPRSAPPEPIPGPPPSVPVSSAPQPEPLDVVFARRAATEAWMAAWYRGPASPGAARPPATPSTKED